DLPCPRVRSQLSDRQRCGISVRGATGSLGCRWRGRATWSQPGRLAGRRVAGPAGGSTRTLGHCHPWLAGDLDLPHARFQCARRRSRRVDTSRVPWPRPRGSHHRRMGRTDASQWAAALLQHLVYQCFIASCRGTTSAASHRVAVAAEARAGRIGLDRSKGLSWTLLMARQAPSLSDEQAPPRGLVFEPDFLSTEEELGLLAEIDRLDFREIVIHGVAARRTARHFGVSYDYERRAHVDQAEPIPARLEPLR